VAPAAVGSLRESGSSGSAGPLGAPTLTLVRWLVDGNNVMGARPDGWWRDREAAARRLVAALDAFAATTGEEVAVVFDGGPFPVPAGAVSVGWAPCGGRDAADHVIAARVAADPDPGSLRVATSDARLATRVRSAGAAVEGAGAFRRRLDV
jgi:predicted RNA-binding protein with PIN domain